MIPPRHRIHSFLLFRCFEGSVDQWVEGLAADRKIFPSCLFSLPIQLTKPWSNRWLRHNIARLRLVNSEIPAEIFMWHSGDERITRCGVFLLTPKACLRVPPSR
jgi:hypothetical protein